MKKTHHVSACTSLLYGRPVDEKIVKAWILNGIHFGISAFHFYDRNPQVTMAKRVLREYFTRDNISVTYNVIEPFAKDMTSKDHMQTIGLNHCISKYAQWTKWLWIADLDEFLFIPDGYFKSRKESPNYLGYILPKLVTEDPNILSLRVRGTIATTIANEAGQKLENYKYRGPYGIGGGRKSLSRTKYAYSVYIHEPDLC
eukprot:Stramenopile-MAST_4_protein_6399